MCDCIKEIEDRIKRQNGASCAGFEHSGSQRSEVHFKPYTQKGEISKQFRYTSVKWRFCPFCGEKI